MTRVDANLLAPVLAVRDLKIDFDVDGNLAPAVHGIDLSVRPGEVVALVGESGSGKSVTAMSILGLLPRNAQVSGSIVLNGDEILTLSEDQLRAARSGHVAMIFQDASAALNPVFTIGFQLMEAVRQREPDLSRSAARSKAIDLLSTVEIPEPERRLGSYPHELSGGQCQRVMIAMALAADPVLLIADEPTTALDVTVQAEVLDVLRRLSVDRGTSILLITHDMGVVADLADRVVVMRAGLVVEEGAARELFTDPQAEYTRTLLASVPRIGARGHARTSEVNSPGGVVVSPAPVLEARALIVEYGSRLSGRFRAVDGVDLTVRRGEIVALVGESGSGKTTIGKAAVGLAPISGGSMLVGGLNLTTANRVERATMRKRVGVVFQNPAMSLNPRYSVADTIGEPLRVHRKMRGTSLSLRVDELLDAVGLPGAWRERYSHELSGGQRQRVAIARAVALDPDLLIADEPTSALDVSVQARVLEVFRELQERLGFACLFISHDLAVVDSLCDRIAVMERGRLVEQGDRGQVLSTPKQAYTAKLLAAAPVADPDEQARRRLARTA